MKKEHPTKKVKPKNDEPENNDPASQELINKLFEVKAKTHFVPGLRVANVMSKILWGADADAAERPLADGLFDQRKLLRAGDFSGIEALLLDQVFVLNAMFSRYAALGAEAKTFDRFQEFYRTALKAQNQCRRTIATLADFTNPKRSATFIKQQNVGINQQINEGQAPVEIPEKKEKPANELLEVNHDARLDTGTAKSTIESNQEVEAMGKINRSKDQSR